MNLLSSAMIFQDNLLNEYEKNLGVNVNRGLKFSNHTDIVSNKANRLSVLHNFFSSVILMIFFHKWSVSAMVCPG